MKIFWLFVLLLLCSCIEVETYMEQQYTNTLDSDILILSYIGEYQGQDPKVDSITVAPGAEYSFYTNVRGEASAKDLFVGFPADSVAVLFQDSLRVVHYGKNNDPDIFISEDVIEIDEPRNIYSFDSYETIEDGSTKHITNYKVIYSFRAEDLEYAISIN